MSANFDQVQITPSKESLIYQEEQNNFFDFFYWDKPRITILNTEKTRTGTGVSSDAGGYS